MSCYSRFRSVPPDAPRPQAEALATVASRHPLQIHRHQATTQKIVCTFHPESSQFIQNHHNLQTRIAGSAIFCLELISANLLCRLRHLCLELISANSHCRLCLEPVSANPHWGLRHLCLEPIFANLHCGFRHLCLEPISANPHCEPTSNSFTLLFGATSHAHLSPSEELVVVVVVFVCVAMDVVSGFYRELDVHVTQGVYALLRNVFATELTGTPTTRGLPAVDSPTPIVIGVTLYLTIVIGGLIWIKTKDLKPRVVEPLLLQVLVLVHNLFCFGLSLYMCVGIIYQAVTHKYSLWGNAYNPEHKEMAILTYLFYMSKYVEFMDTVIMIMKRSTRQISVLHVYHHSSISLIWWAIAHHAPGGEAYFSAALNSGVHVFMYAYYFLAACLRSNPKLRAKYLFWGRYLTQFQMFQFMLNLVQAYYDIKVNAPYPQWLIKILFYYMISLLCLFGNFYVQKYIINGSSNKEKEDKTE